MEFCVFNPGFIVTQLSTKVRVMRGYEHIANSLRKIIPLLGANADAAATGLVELALGSSSMPAARSRERAGVVLPLLFRRLVLREPPPCNADDIEIDIVEPVP